MATIVNTGPVLKKIFVIRLKASFEKTNIPEDFSKSDIFVYKDNKYNSLDDYVDAMAEDIISDGSNFAVVNVKSDLEVIDIIINMAERLSEELNNLRLNSLARVSTEISSLMSTDSVTYSTPLVTAVVFTPPLTGTTIAAPLFSAISNLYNLFIKTHTDFIDPLIKNQKDMIKSLVDSIKVKLIGHGLNLLSDYELINANAKITKIESILSLV